MFKIDGDGQMDINDIEIFLEDGPYRGNLMLSMETDFIKTQIITMPLLRRFGSTFLSY